MSICRSVMVKRGVVDFCGSKGSVLSVPDIYKVRKYCVSDTEYIEMFVDGIGGIVSNAVLGHLKSHKMKQEIVSRNKLRGMCFSSEFYGDIGSDFIDEKLVNSLSVGEEISVRGYSRGMGFAGVMKRHGFSGQPASHGASLSHRGMGSTGQCQDPGRVFKGKKMPGAMGNIKVCMRGLKILCIASDYCIVSGSIPGHIGSMIYVNRKTGVDCE